MDFDKAFERLIGSDGISRGWLFSGFPRNNFVHVAFGHAKQLTKLLLCEPPCRPKQSDRVNFIVAKKTQITVFSMLPVELGKSRMPVVFSIRSPLQVLGSVVVLIAVLVVDSSCRLRSFTKERLGNYRVNTSQSSVRQIDGWVSLFRTWVHKTLTPDKGPTIFVSYSMRKFLYSTH